MAYEIMNTCMLVPGLGLSSGECASWVQAWGSIAAILAAVAIAGWQRHRDREEAALGAKARAEVAGTSVLLKMNPILGCCQSIELELRSAEQDPTIPFYPVQLAELANRQIYATEGELLAIAEHAPVCARLLVRGRNLVQQGVQALNLVSEQRHRTHPAARSAQLHHLIELFQVTTQQFEGARAQLEQIAPSD